MIEITEDTNTKDWWITTDKRFLGPFRDYYAALQYMGDLLNDIEEFLDEEGEEL